jgi:glucose-1-phosphate adenylyltransferase
MLCNIVACILAGGEGTRLFPLTVHRTKPDVGTIDAYWEAHMDLLGPRARFQLSQPQWPLRTTHAQSPPTTFGSPGDLGAGQGGGVTNSIIAQECRLQGGRVERAILSPGVWIEAEAEVQESILFDGVHIGRGAQVRRAILDHGTVVPPGARIGFDLAADGDRFTVSDGALRSWGTPPWHELSRRSESRVPQVFIRSLPLPLTGC